MWNARQPPGAIPLVFLVLVTVVVAACATGGTGDTGVWTRGGGTVVSGVALTDGHGSVLDALRGKVPSLIIQRRTGGCPRITLRNDASLTVMMEPHVYVDGTRATDTCILESLRSHDVRKVEIYPTGVSGRPGYPSHAHGLILLFLRS